MLKGIILILSVANFVVSNPTPNRRIVGGGNAGLGQMPYMASIRGWGSTFHFAGGVLISDRWILTSANYMNGRADDSLNIVLGIIDLASQGTSRRSERIVMHPSFNSNTKANDIACVLMMTPSITFSAAISSVFIVPEIIANGLPAVTGGFGSTNPNMGENSQQLRRLDVATSECQNFQTTTTSTWTTTTPIWWETTNAGPPTAPTDPQTTTAPATIPPTTSTICTRPLTTGGICTSDIGGPLVTMQGLIGIASTHPIPCASGTDVFTRISWFRNWIGSITGI